MNCGGTTPLMYLDGRNASTITMWLACIGLESHCTSCRWPSAARCLTHDGSTATRQTGTPSSTGLVLVESKVNQELGLSQDSCAVNNTPSRALMLHRTVASSVATKPRMRHRCHRWSSHSQGQRRKLRGGGRIHGS